MESNPIFWLELRQARRNYWFFITIGLGCLMGGYLLCRALVPEMQSTSLFYGLWGCVPLVFYTVCTLLIPLSTGLKLASQQIRDDLLIKTPISASQILWGKLKVAMLQLACLHLPTLPGLFLLFLGGDFGCVLVSLAVATITLSATLVVLGFMAGARTTLLRAVMACLAGVFAFGLSGSSLAIFGLILENYRRDYIFHPNPVMEFVAALLAFLLAFFMSCLIYRMGIVFLSRDKNLPEILVGSVLAIFFVSFFYFAVCLGTVPNGGALFLMIPWCAFVIPPPVAMAVVSSNDRAHVVESSEALEE